MFLQRLLETGQVIILGKKYLCKRLSKNSCSVDLSVIKYTFFNPILDGGSGQKATPLSSFPPVTSTKVRISPQNFLTFSFNPFATLV